MEEENKEKQENENKKADTDDKVMLVEKALKSFCCYLYVGKSHPYYKAQPWNDDETYPIDQRLQCLEVLAANKETELVPIDKIKLAMDSKLIRRPETLMFALAMCARQKKSEKLRAAAYYFLAEHCKEWKYFILFIKYTKILCNAEGSDEKEGNGVAPIGCGHGWKNAVNKWYLTQSPTSLFQLVTHHNGSHGWKHKDILKLSHPNTVGLEVEKQAIMCYIIRGLKEAKKKYGNDPEAKKMLDQLGAVEIFKNSEKPETVAKSIKTGNFTVDQVHPKALKSRKVWLALLERMDVRTILKNVPKLTNLGLLTEVGHATQFVVQSLTDENNLRWNKLLPEDVLSILSLYKKELFFGYKANAIDIKNRELEELVSLWACIQSIPEEQMEDFRKRMLERFCKEEAEEVSAESKIKPKTRSSKKRKVTGVTSVGNANNSKKNAKTEANSQTAKYTSPRQIKQPNKRIIDALRTSLSIAQTVDITESSKRRYLVSVKLPGKQSRKYKHLHPALAIAFPLLHREDIPENAVTIVGQDPLSPWWGIPCEITKDMNFDNAMYVLMELKRKNAQIVSKIPANPVISEYKKQYDVFIYITNEQPLKNYVEITDRHKGCDLRVINVIISRAPFNMKSHHISNNTLTIYGFDSHVPWIIEAFVRGLF